MTIYELSIISTSGFPYYNKIIKPIPKGVKVHLRFFDFSDFDLKDFGTNEFDLGMKFDLKAGLISALFEFARNINKKIELLEFKSKSEITVKSQCSDMIKGDVLITTTTEPYILHNQVQKKIRLIYQNFISPKIPLDSSYQMLHHEETNLINLLTDKAAKEHFFENEKEISKIAKKFINEMGSYGLKAIICTSFDLSPIKSFSKNDEYSIEDINNILRNIGNIPDIDPMNWKYRQSLLRDKTLWVFIINSGIGVTIENLFEPYYYLLLAEPNSYLGEFPGKLANEFNRILR
ncbi:MAG: hypothetical protein GF317_06990 [Candidatus Lokiarchaeota archaeon]|nr:hypothetical protein [Candidatus Lokiarchaeota archaeon]MBD3199454.1 hypothetical protein [Candidatus Lokiarchaeota archaeon]